LNATLLFGSGIRVQLSVMLNFESFCVQCSQISNWILLYDHLPVV